MRHLGLALTLLLSLQALDAAQAQDKTAPASGAMGAGTSAAKARDEKAASEKAAVDKAAKEKAAAADKAAADKAAADKAAADKAAADKATADKAAEKKVAPRVTHIYVGSAAVIGTEADPNEAHLGDWLTLDVAGLDDLVKQADTKPLQLYMNGLPLKGVPAIYYKPEKQDDNVPAKLRFEPLELRFELARTDGSKDTWSALLGGPGFASRQVKVSVGPAGCTDNCTAMAEPGTIELTIVRGSGLIVFILFFFCFLAGLLYLALKTPILHDNGDKSPWSLGRCQMAWWFFFVASSFLFIWVVTGSYSTLTNSVLALIGISAATGLAGAVIDDNKQSEMKQEPDLKKEQTSLLAAASPAASQRLQQLATQLAQVPQPQVAKGFFADILSDEGGISLHRFQIVVWTLVFTVIFVARVFVHLAMPDFDSQLLALMGISSGTYIGFKFPEKQA